MKSLYFAPVKTVAERSSLLRCILLPLSLSVLLSACDGGSSAVLTGTGPVISASPSSVAVDNVVVENIASIEAATLLSDSTANGPVKIMATGDSITQGIVGASSYRREFTRLMEAASCSFEMVGSQETSLVSGVDPDCIDTGVIGDGWGWDGTQSCLVGQPSNNDVYTGAHEGYSSHRADHFLTGHTSSTGSNAGISDSMGTFSPDVVLLHIGSVDMYNQQTVASTVVDIENLLNVIFETKPGTLVFIANIIPWYSTNPYPEIASDVEALGNAVEQLVASANNPLLKLVDVRTGFTEAMMMTDMIHPNAEGEAHIANAFMNAYQSVANCTVE